jgi:hypothetical protein
MPERSVVGDERSPDGGGGEAVTQSKALAVAAVLITGAVTRIEIGKSQGKAVADGFWLGHLDAIAELLAPGEAVEAAFRAGYHCRWHKEQGAYCFDPAMSPGDPDGAFAAWRER